MSKHNELIDSLLENFNMPENVVISAVYALSAIDVQVYLDDETLFYHFGQFLQKSYLLKMLLNLGYSIEGAVNLLEELLNSGHELNDLCLLDVNKLNAAIQELESSKKTHVHTYGMGK